MLKELGYKQIIAISVILIFIIGESLQKQQDHDKSTENSYQKKEFTEEEKKKLSPKLSESKQCEAQLRHYSVGDFNITGQNQLKKLHQKYPFILLIVTADWCAHCCKYEHIFQNFQNKYINNSIQYFKKNATIKIGRIKLDNNQWIDKLFKIPKLPFLAFSVKDKIETFPHYFSEFRIVNFINKIIEPIVTLKNFQEVEDFLHREEKDFNQTIRNTVKVVAFFFDREDLEDFYLEFVKAAEMSIQRGEIYFGILENKQEIKKAKAKYGSLWFSDVDLSSLIIHHSKMKGVYNKVEFDYKSQRLSYKILKHSIGLFEQINGDNKLNYELLGLPLMIAYLNPQNGDINTQKSIEICEQLAVKYKGQIVFGWVDNTEQYQQRELVGIFHDKVPAFAFNPVANKGLYSFPVDQPINKKNLDKFVQNYITNNYRDAREIYKEQLKVKSEKLQRSEIYQYLNETVILNQENVYEIVLKEGYDVMVLFFDSQKSQNLEHLCKNINRMAERFRSLRIESVKVCVLDVYYTSIPSQIPGVEVPGILFFGAFEKNPPFKIYTGVPRTLPLMKYIEENADVKFKLPELPHLPEHLHEKYYQQKYQMEQERLLKEKQKTDL